MRDFSFAKRVGFGVMIVASLAFEPLDNCKLCHQSAPVPAEHVAVTGAVSWPTCAACHGLDPAATEANPVIIGMHENHVRKLSFDCAVCHAFNDSDDQTTARQHLDQLLDKGATQ